MRPKFILFILSFSLVISGCGVTGLRGNGTEPAGLSSQYLQDLDKELTSLSSQNTAAARTQLATLATKAGAAAKQSSDTKNRVAFYRVAAVAAWQAGSAGESLVLPMSDAGAAACDALPDKDNTAPRDCSLIRLAAPMAVQDMLAREVINYQHKAGAGGKLPPADLTPLRLIFEGFESQFAKVSTIRNSLGSLAVPQEFKVRTDRQWLMIYCNAVKAWSLSGDVEGAPLDSFTAMAKRKKEMAEQLESKGVAADCRTVPATEHFNDQ